MVNVGGARSGRPTGRSNGAGTAGLLKLSGEVFGGGKGRRRSRRRPGAGTPDRRRVVRRGMQVAVVVGGGNFFRGAELPGARHGPRSGRLHGHAGYGHELPGAAGLPGEGRHRHQGPVPRFRWPRSPSRTSPAGPSGIWRRDAWSSSVPAPACRTSLRTRSRHSERWKSMPTSC